MQYLDAGHEGVDLEYLLNDSYYRISSQVETKVDCEELYKGDLGHRSSLSDSSLNSLQIIISDDLKNNQKTGEIHLSKKILHYGLVTNGRLDIYIQAHFLKSFLQSIKKESVYPEFFESLSTMESDLFGIIQAGEAEKLTEKKYLELVEIFVRHGEKITNSLKTMKKLLAIFQNLNDNESIKILERLLVQLLGHPEVRLKVK